MGEVESFLCQMGWNYRPSGADQFAVECCPLCPNTNYKFYVSAEGLWDCKVCGEHGNLYQLKEKTGYSITGVQSMKDAASRRSAPQELPDFNLFHRNLMENEKYGDVLDFLVHDRAISLDTLKRLNIGAAAYKGKSGCGREGEVVLTYVFPYFDSAGNPTFFKARSASWDHKEFWAPSGREVPLYNEAVLKPGMEELTVVEGEVDAVSLISAGYENVVGIPGANVQKTPWIERLDRVASKQIYLCLDSDKTGQEAARALATKIGIDKVKNIVLPSFEVDGKPGKDINDWFRAGKTLEDFLALRDAARMFDVQGVQSVADVLFEILDDIENRGNEPQYQSQYPSLNRKVGGWNDGYMVGLLAAGKHGKTTLLLNIMNYLAAQCGHPSYLWCGEMTQKMLVTKWISMVTNTDSKLITNETVGQAMEYARNMKADFLFGRTRNNHKDVIESIRQAVRRYGTKIVGVDNLQLLNVDARHATQETMAIATELKNLALELNILLFLIIQPNRIAEGQVAQAHNAYNSSAIEKLVDQMLCAHRNKVANVKADQLQGFMETEENFEPQLYIRTDLSRFSAGGWCTLYLDGATSTVRELGEGDITVPTGPSGLIKVEETQEI
jgi:twinkle protein